MNQKKDQNDPNKQNQRWQGNITIDTREFQNSVRKYHKNQYSIELENQREK